MKVLVVGCDGQLGRELTRYNWPRGTEVEGRARGTGDISELGVADQLLAAQKPAIVVNAAAYTAVDRAETHADQAYAGNVRVPQLLAQACARYDVPLIHISTDYVFDGKKMEPYVESDPTAPVNVYGHTKCKGEEAVRSALKRHLILRASWLYSPFGNNFAKTMLRLADAGREVRVVDDQFGSPTAAGDVADCIAKLTPFALGSTTNYGTYHVTNAGTTSWHGFAEEIFADLQRRTGRRVKLKAIASNEYPTPARRPSNSRLGCGLLKQNFGISLRDWREALRDVLEELHAGGASRAS
jgi:dTDP-4-dehydrorhamnose reductase